MSMGAGRVRCHSNLDLVTTLTGDIAITPDDVTNYRQRLFMWLATPKGERIDPSVGCCLYDFLHNKATSTTARTLELYLASDLAVAFPELDVKSVRCKLSSDNRTFSVDVKLGDESLTFLFSDNDLLNISSQLAEVYSITG